MKQDFYLKLYMKTWSAKAGLSSL